jgi:deoxyribonuclease V
MDPINITVKEAAELQVKLSKRVKVSGPPGRINNIAAADIAYIRGEEKAFCAVAVFSYPELRLLNIVFARGRITFPYIPGFLSFREGPLIIRTFMKLDNRPDAIIADGHGIAHPRRFGLASYIGLELNIPCIGCAKSFLYGLYEEPSVKKGSTSILYDENNYPLGIVLRSRENVKPVFVSPGHLAGIHESADIIMNCTGKYRIPEPQRFVNIEINKYRNKTEKNLNNDANMKQT